MTSQSWWVQKKSFKMKPAQKLPLSLRLADLFSYLGYHSIISNYWGMSRRTPKIEIHSVTWQKNIRLKYMKRLFFFFYNPALVSTTLSHITQVQMDNNTQQSWAMLGGCSTSTCVNNEVAILKRCDIITENKLCHTLIGIQAPRGFKMSILVQKLQWVCHIGQILHTGGLSSGKGLLRMWLPIVFLVRLPLLGN